LKTRRSNSFELQEVRKIGQKDSGALVLGGFSKIVLPKKNGTMFLTGDGKVWEDQRQVKKRDVAWMKEVYGKEVEMQFG